MQRVFASPALMRGNVDYVLRPPVSVLR